MLWKKIKKEIEINGCCEVSESLTLDEFNDLFIDFIEEHGWYFGGGIKEYKMRLKPHNVVFCKKYDRI